MKIILSGKNFSLTPSLHRFVEENVSSLKKYSKNILKAKVELDVDKNQKSGDINRVEIWLFLPKKVLQIGLKAPEMHEAITAAVNKMERQLIKYKDKKSTRIRNIKRRSIDR